MTPARPLARAREAIAGAIRAFAYDLGCAPTEITIDPEVFADVYRDAHAGTRSTIPEATRLAFDIPLTTGAYGLTFIRFGEMTLRAGGSTIADAVAEAVRRRDAEWLAVVRECSVCGAPATRGDTAGESAHCDAHTTPGEVDLKGAKLVRETGQ